MSKDIWYISGDGSISCLITSNLLSNNIKCYQLVRNSKPIIPQTLVHENQHYLLPSPRHLIEIESIANIVIATKSYDVLPFFQHIQNKLTTDANIILCHNGLGTIEQITPLLNSQHNLYFCTTNNGVYKEGNNAFHVGIGPSYYSAISSTNKPNNHRLIHNDFEAMFSPCYEEHDLLPLLWKKLIINCAINPLTAIHQVTNGKLAQPEYDQLINGIVNEGILVASQLGITLPNNMLDVVYNVINDTKDNYSSMYQDVKNQKRTEIDFINGYLVNQAQKVSVPAPINASLVEKIQQLSIG